ncbi:MAG TPA: flagellar motor protein MotB [Aquamicrobium sp.]|nr:flagellar motor protein MotB [Aquamicrobium sp.]
MSTFDAEEGKREIIIVRRHGGDHEDGHHGGVWKIAFADFMTALMCFFLVMWLVNATSDQTKAAIASYFNPMTLVDKSPARKGIDDPGQETPPEPSPSDTSRNAPQPEDAPGQFAHSLATEDTHKTSDQHLFSDPYAVLAEIAAQTATLQNVSEKGDGGAQTSGPATGAEGGESYRDPFAPDFWSQEIARVEDDAELDVFRRGRDGEAEKKEATTGIEAQATDAPVEPQAQTDLLTPEEIAPEARVERVAEELRAGIAEAFGRDSALNDAISVTAQVGGVLISVTDELDFGMFEVGSAVPKGELVLAMEKIAAALNGQQGRIRINGHTDGRPFRNAAYDNWRLSTARAHAAYYMLARAGMDETRIREVAGFADRQLKVADDPFASVNRRIEIFLETGG